MTGDEEPMSRSVMTASFLWWRTTQNPGAVTTLLTTQLDTVTKSLLGAPLVSHLSSGQRLPATPVCAFPGGCHACHPALRGLEIKLCRNIFVVGSLPYLRRERPPSCARAITVAQIRVCTRTSLAPSTFAERAFMNRRWFV